MFLLSSVSCDLLFIMFLSLVTLLETPHSRSVSGCQVAVDLIISAAGVDQRQCVADLGTGVTLATGLSGEQ